MREEIPKLTFSGKKIGNQETMSLLLRSIFSGKILSSTILLPPLSSLSPSTWDSYSTASKFPASPCTTPLDRHTNVRQHSLAL